MTASPVESNGGLPLGDDLKFTCRLTACTPGSASGPTLCNKYVRTLSLSYIRTAVVLTANSKTLQVENGRFSNQDHIVADLSGLESNQNQQKINNNLKIPKVIRINDLKH